MLVSRFCCRETKGKKVCRYVQIYRLSPASLVSSLYLQKRFCAKISISLNLLSLQGPTGLPGLPGLKGEPGPKGEKVTNQFSDYF